MTKKLLLFFLSVFIFYSGISFSQLGNSNMNLLSNLNQHYTSTLYSACWGYRAPNGREYAILGCPTGTAFIDITDSTNIHEVAYKTGLNNSWREMKVFSNYAYIVSEATNSGLQIFNLQYLPDSVPLVTTYTYSGYNHTHSISQSGPYLYLHGGNCTPGGTDVGGVSILDLTNPTAPVRRGSWSNYYVHDSRVLDDTIWACNIYNPPGTISAINVNNKDNPVTIASWVNNPNPFPHNCAIPMFNRKYILTTDETSSPVGKLKIWNKTSISGATLVTSWQPTGITGTIVHNVEIYGRYALIAHYTAGIRIVDINNLSSPTEVAYYDSYPSANNSTYNGCWGVFAFPSGKIIASDRQTGLYVLRPTTVSLVGTQNNQNNIPQNFELKQNYPNPFNPSTKIEYSVPKGSYVTIKVFDVLGKQVGLLVDEYKQAGNYYVSYDAGRLSSGVYYYRIESNGFIQTKKMTLVK